MSYTIIQKDYFEDNKDEPEIFYLNHAYLGSLSFGSEDMAWTTDDKEKAELMLEKCEAKASRLFGAYSEFDIQEW